MLHLWEMEFNVKKCKVLRVACCKCISEREYFLGETKLEHVPIEKDLQGILISHDLSWNPHVDINSTRAQRILNLLYKSCKETTDIRTKKLPYITNGCYDPTPKETLPTENKLNAGPQDSFLARSLLNTL